MNLVDFELKTERVVEDHEGDLEKSCQAGRLDLFHFAAVLSHAKQVNLPLPKGFQREISAFRVRRKKYIVDD